MAFRKLSLGMELEACATGYGSALPRELIAKAINDAHIVGLTARASDTGPALGETVWCIVPELNVGVDRDTENLFTHTGIEFVSPVFVDDSNETREEWRSNVEIFMKAVMDHVPPVLTVNRTCGYHVHVGVGITGSFTFEEVKKIAVVVVLYEELIDEFHSSHRSTGGGINDMLRPLRDHSFSGLDGETIKQYILDTETLEQLQNLVNPAGKRSSTTPGAASSSRQFKVNFVSLSTRRTIEFRQHRGTLDSDIVCAWAAFVLALVRAALELSDKDVRALDPESTPLRGGLVAQTLVDELVARLQLQKA